MQILKLTISTSVDLLLRSKGYFFKILSDKLFPFEKTKRSTQVKVGFTALFDNNQPFYLPT